MLGLFRNRSRLLADRIENLFRWWPRAADGEYVISAGDMFLTPTGWSWDRPDAMVFRSYVDAEKVRLKLLRRDDKLDGLFSVRFYLKEKS